MNAEDQVPITLVCFGCHAEQVIRIPRERGITSGRYAWECFACQEKRYGVLSSGRQGNHKVEQAGRGDNGRPTEEREGK